MVQFPTCKKEPDTVEKTHYKYADEPLRTLGDHTSSKGASRMGRAKAKDFPLEVPRALARSAFVQTKAYTSFRKGV